MSAHIFPPEHFETAERLGHSLISGKNRIVAELAFTLTKLHDNDGMLAFSLEELAAYHMLHYGVNREEVVEVADYIIEKGLSEAWLLEIWNQDNLKLLEELPSILEGSLEARGLNGATNLALGRIAINGDADIPEELKKYTLDVHVREPDLSVPSRFLYSKKGITMSYTGTLQHEDTVDFLRKYYSSFADAPPGHYHFDTIKVRSKEERVEFIAASSVLGVEVIESWTSRS